MNKIILGLFRILYNIVNIFILLCSFTIIMMTCYWIENIVNANWIWLNVFKSALNQIIDFTNNIIPFAGNVFGRAFDSKILVSSILLILLILVSKYFLNILQDLKSSYEDIYNAYKLNTERNFNNKLSKNISKEQIKISKYMVLINTKIKKKFSHAELNINIDEQNKIMNDYIFSKINTQYQNFNGGFLYYFDDFNKIDDILTILFTIIKSSSPLDYAICIQIENDLDKIKKLADLQNIGKIIMNADTLLRYKHNKAHKFGTTCVGVYQQEEETLEVHEFQEIAI